MPQELFTSTHLLNNSPVFERPGLHAILPHLLVELTSTLNIQPPLWKLNKKTAWLNFHPLSLPKIFLLLRAALLSHVFEEILNLSKNEVEEIRKETRW